MAFQLKTRESLSDGINRNVRRQIKKAIHHLESTRKPPQRGTRANEAVPNEVRKCFKKVRAALRLVREELGDEVYREANYSLRDAARLLSELCDADILVDILDKLGAQRFAALARLPDWRVEGEGWATLEKGLRRVYRTGDRAFALAAENPSVANLHEWRKQAKCFWLQLQLLGAAWTSSEKKLINRTHKLSRLLGEDHDLAVLRETLAADPGAYGGHLILKGVFAVIDHRREDLERQAFALGRKLYKDSPSVFTNRIVSYWKT